MALERHYPIRIAAKMCGVGSRRTMLVVLRDMGWRHPNPGRGKRIVVPESLVYEIQRRLSVDPGPRSVTKTLAGLMSRWMIPLAWAASRASAM